MFGGCTVLIQGVIQKQLKGEEEYYYYSHGMCSIRAPKRTIVPIISMVWYRYPEKLFDRCRPATGLKPHCS